MYRMHFLEILDEYGSNIFLLKTKKVVGHISERHHISGFKKNILQLLDVKP